MRRNPQTVDVHLDWNEMSPSVRLVVDQERARALGLNVQDVAQTLQTLLSGIPVTNVREGIEKVGVVARAVAPERLDLGRIGDLTIVSRGGVPVPVSRWRVSNTRTRSRSSGGANRDMAITVRSDVIDGVQPPDVTNAIWPTLKSVQDGWSRLPAGDRRGGGGIREGKRVALRALPDHVPGHAHHSHDQLQNFSRLILVFLTAPLGLIGASLALNLASKPFGFVALLGLIALAGMIMRNAVILVDQIETDVAEGRTRREAIVEATVRRARPVVLTALAAVLAMIPLSGSAFWGPMAFTIMGGLFVATFLTLLFLPALYALWFRRSLDERGGVAAPEPAPVHPYPAPYAVAAE
jgi:multidrug efflux pump subunit AcrB